MNTLDLINQMTYTMDTAQLLVLVFGTVGLAVYAIFLPFRVAKVVRRKIAYNKRVRAVDSSIAAIVAELPSLKVQLIEIAHLAQIDALAAIVRFFNATSPWHDRNLRELRWQIEDLGDRYEPFLTDFTSLVAQFAMTGRDRYGMNRTRVGELVTDENVYLGNIYGLWTFTVQNWKNGKDRPKGGWGHSGEYFKTRNGHDVVCDQARHFMNDHIVVMIALIDKLTASNSDIRLVA